MVGSVVRPVQSVTERLGVRSSPRRADPAISQFACRFLRRVCRASSDRRRSCGINLRIVNSIDPIGVTGGDNLVRDRSFHEERSIREIGSERFVARLAAGRRSKYTRFMREIGGRSSSLPREALGRNSRPREP